MATEVKRYQSFEIVGIMAHLPQTPMGRPHGRGVVRDHFNFAFADATSRRKRG
ncbi:MAG: hypothetical protein WBE80_18105 [Methylocella sp.]